MRQTTLVIYAIECDPRSLPFDTWSPTKNAAFGHDDGAEFADVTQLRILAKNPLKPGTTPEHLVIQFTPTFNSLSIAWRQVS